MRGGSACAPIDRHGVFGEDLARRAAQRRALPGNSARPWRKPHDVAFPRTEPVLDELTLVKRHGAPGDLCDVCPDADDLVDVDGDGVADGCDDCVAVGDSDLDSVPDLCDVCLGDDTIDFDADGIPANCDLWDVAGPLVDCDLNQIEDAAELYTGRYETFGSSTAYGATPPAHYTLNAGPGSTPAVVGGVAGLTNVEAAGQLASMVFEPLHERPTLDVEYTFDFRLEKGLGGVAGQGFAFSLLPADLYDGTTLFDEEGVFGTVVTVTFNTHADPGELSDNSIILTVGAATAGEWASPVDLDDGVWRRAVISVTPDGLMSLVLREYAPSLVEHTVVSGALLFGTLPAVRRYGFGARTLGTGQLVLIDNVKATDRSDLADCDGDGVPDACGAAWSTIGSALPGSGGVAPTLSGSGGLCGDDWTSLEVSDALPGALGWIVIGVTQIDAPFKQGVMVPSPDLLLPVLTSGHGDVALSFPFPTGVPANTTLSMQAWVQDGGAPKGFAGSQALGLTTP